MNALAGADERRELIARARSAARISDTKLKWLERASIEAARHYVANAEATARDISRRGSRIASVWADSDENGGIEIEGDDEA
jgi:hypothetical protein